MVGKTTLDRYMTTPGEMEEIPIDERTDHFKILTRYVLPRPTRKRLRYKGERRVTLPMSVAKTGFGTCG